MALEPSSWVMLVVGFVILGGGFVASVLIAWRRHRRETGWAKGAGLAADVDLPASDGSAQETERPGPDDTRD